MYRAFKPALKKKKSYWLESLFPLQRDYHSPVLLSGLSVYQSHPLSIAGIGWWVIHLWVEGFFEVFATVVIAYLCSELGFLKKSSALRATYQFCIWVVV